MIRKFLVVFSISFLLSGCVNFFGGKHKTSGGFHYKSKINTTNSVSDKKEVQGKSGS